MKLHLSQIPKTAKGETLLPLNISSEELTMIDGTAIDEKVESDSCNKELSSWRCSTAKDASLDGNFFLGSDKGDTIHKDISPNTPHPSIEYPPLYFVIKRYPKILNAMYYLYRVRWELQYPLQRRVPFSKKLRKIGITCTWGELLLWAPPIHHHCDSRDHDQLCSSKCSK